MKKTIGILLLIIITLFSGCAPLVLSTTDLTGTSIDEPIHIRYAKPIDDPVYNTCTALDQKHIEEILLLTNNERDEQGLPELSLSPTLCKIAQLRAADMAENDYFAHESPSGESVYSLLQKYKVFYFSSAENIGKGNVSCERMVEGWMCSEGHRESMLSTSYHQLGIGIAKAENGDIYWVQVFIN